MQNVRKRTTEIVRDLAGLPGFCRGGPGFDGPRRLVPPGARIQAGPHDFEVRGADGYMSRMTSLCFRESDGCCIELHRRH